jgi:Zn-dependent metalloprotease
MDISQKKGHTLAQYGREFDPVCTIMPPFILREIMKNGTEDQREAALDTLLLSNAHRAIRQIAISGPTFFSPAGAALQRTVYDAHNTPNISEARVVRREGQSQVRDIAVNEAYDYSGYTYQFYKEILRRNSIDNHGMPLDSIVHFREDPQRPYQNASWYQDRMIYGDGHPSITNRFTIDLAVVGHELSHGVVQYEGGLTYRKDTGAINEHFADVFGMLVRQHKNNESAEDSNWLLGEGLWRPNINGKALRSMKEPGSAYGPDPLIGKDPQPSHMRDYKDLPPTPMNDYGGVHINSGIPNKAFYKAAIGIGGKAWEKAGHIWYVSLVNLPNNPNNTTFEDLANTTFAEAGKLFGVDSREQRAVSEAWAKVGITVNQPRLISIILNKNNRTRRKKSRRKS